jgi:CDP-diacylglycerol--glycerol-3-phosphate 3-phosphatidyltransferase
MVSYTRARAEGLGLDARSGLLARPERVVLLAAGLLIGGQDWLLWTMLILATASVLTSIQRIAAVRRVALRADESAPGAGTASAPSRNGAWRPEGGWNLPFLSGGRHRRAHDGSSESSVSSERAARR